MFKAFDVEYVLFDVETTGLSPIDGDRIIEIAAVRLRRGEIQDRFSSLVNPRRPMAAQGIHNISEEMVKDAPFSEEVLPKMVEFAAGACLVAHNASFDIKFLAYELALKGRKLRVETPVLDTMKMSRSFLPYLASHRMESLAHSLGVTVKTTHRAMADVEILVEVFKRLLSMASDYNIHQLQDMITHFGVEKPNFRIVNMPQPSLF
ncbi:MAG: 3'-5' exonuclease [Candidatus Omnitrophica bacterium]|nr:3'-5' exonuclease [Candidatus Omnitrophota bacterium]